MQISPPAQIIIKRKRSGWQAALRRAPQQDDRPGSG